MRLAIVIVFLLLTSVSSRAEKYLTVEQALKIAFPSATRFDQQTLRFNAEQRKAIEEKSGVAVKVDGNKVAYAYEDARLLGVLFVDHVLGKHEVIDYTIAITPGGEVLGIEILEYRESYGYEIRGAKWRKQFQGKRAGEPVQLNKDIYNISGATMSCRHVTEGTKRVLATFHLLCRPKLDVGGVRNDEKIRH
jgi:Na+-translocating ferredoxin:NAD+ oxidoreductase subunit G